MALTAYENPEHVQYPRGVKCLDCAEFTPAELAACAACGSDVVALIEQGEWEGGTPDPNHPHHVEIDCSTGMVGYTRLTATEIADLNYEAAQRVAAEKAEREKKDSRDAILRERAKADPAFAALCDALGLRDIGIRLDD